MTNCPYSGDCASESLLGKCSSCRENKDLKDDHYKPKKTLPYVPYVPYVPQVPYVPYVPWVPDYPEWPTTPYPTWIYKTRYATTTWESVDVPKTDYYVQC